MQAARARQRKEFSERVRERTKTMSPFRLVIPPIPLTQSPAHTQLPAQQQHPDDDLDWLKDTADHASAEQHGDEEVRHATGSEHVACLQAWEGAAHDGEGEHEQ